MLSLTEGPVKGVLASECTALLDLLFSLKDYFK